jgi:hypothetical protein
VENVLRELAQLVGRSLARRWLARGEATSRTVGASDDEAVPTTEEADGSRMPPPKPPGALKGESNSGSQTVEPDARQTRRRADADK